MVVFQHHVDVKGISTKGCFCRVDRNPLGIGCGNFVIHMGCWYAECLIFNVHLNVVIETTGAQPVFYLF